MGRKHCGKRRKCWLPAFTPSLTMFSKGFFFKVIKSRDCVVKNYEMRKSLKALTDNKLNVAKMMISL